MANKEKLLELIGQVQDEGRDYSDCFYYGDKPAIIDNGVLVEHLINNGVIVQKLIPMDDVSWMGEDIANLCIRYMTEFADFHGYASQRKVKEHIIRLLQAEAEGRIAIMPEHTEVKYEQ